MTERGEPWAVGRGPWAVGRGPWAVNRMMGCIGSERSYFADVPR